MSVTGIEAQVCEDIKRRQEMGLSKYGQTVADNPLPLPAWLQHGYEELLDGAIYLKRAMDEMRRNPFRISLLSVREEADSLADGIATVFAYRYKSNRVIPFDTRVGLKGVEPNHIVVPYGVDREIIYTGYQQLGRKATGPFSLVICFGS